MSITKGFVFGVVLMALWPCVAPAQFEERPSKELVRLDKALPGILIDLRYASSRNIAGRPFYPSGVAWIRPETAQGLKKVQEEIKKHGLQLVVWDAYRPPWAQAVLWEACPNAEFVAPPSSISRHSRGTSVDVGLADLAGNPVPVPSDHDVFTPEADQDLRDLPRERARNAEFLRNAMFANGFSGVPAEWWHYDLRNWKKFPVIDQVPGPH